MTENNQGPFSGLLVVDFSNFIAGPFVSWMLADHGARVIKIERPGSGDGMRVTMPNHASNPEVFEAGMSATFNTLGRGKESIALNLKDADDREMAAKLVRKADVVLENFEPGVMERLGFDYEAVRKINPNVVYVSVSGFGQTGPYARHTAFDAVIQGMSGLMAHNGFPDGPPTKTGPSIADTGAGIYAFAACATALYGREKTGGGCHVDVAMQDAMMTAILETYSAYGTVREVPLREGNEISLSTPFGSYDCKDGPIMICVFNPSEFERFCKALDHPEWLQDPRFKWPVPITTTHRQDWNAVFLPVLKSKTVGEWKVILDNASIPCGPILNVDQVTATEHIKFRKMMVDAGPLKALGNPLKFSAYPDPADNLGKAPKIDEHGEAIRKEFS